jgi:hypothetical protein
MTNSLTASAPNFLDELGAHRSLDGFAGGFAGEFAGGEQRRDDGVTGERARGLEDGLGHDVGGDGAFGFAEFGGEFLLGGDDGLDGFLAELQRGNEVGLGDFVGGAFEHDDIGVIADVDEVEIAALQLVVGGVGDELAFDAADADGADGAGPGDVGDESGRPRRRWRRGCRRRSGHRR